MYQVGLNGRQDWDNQKGEWVENEQSKQKMNSLEYRQFAYPPHELSLLERLDVWTQGMRCTFQSRGGTGHWYQVFANDHPIYSKAQQAHGWARFELFWNPPADEWQRGRACHRIRNAFAYGASRASYMGSFLVMATSGTLGIVTTLIHNGRQKCSRYPIGQKLLTGAVLYPVAMVNLCLTYLMAAVRWLMGLVFGLGATIIASPFIAGINIGEAIGNRLEARKRRLHKALFTKTNADFGKLHPGFMPPVREGAATVPTAS